MALTEKGKNAVLLAFKYFPNDEFSAAMLTEACGEKIVAATLTGAANNGYLEKIEGTSPAMYRCSEYLAEMIKELCEENKGCTNATLCAAKNNQNDEFYTSYEVIEEEIMKYRKQFKNKIVYLPCDDPAEKKSEFWSFFVNNFDAFGLKKLIATHYNENGKAYKIWIDGDTTGDGWVDDGDALQEDLIGNGDFRSPECISILEECDIVCTNPPFSLIKEFVPLILKHNKKMLIICPQNAFKYADIFPYMKEGLIWPGYSFNKTFDFIMDDNYTVTKNGYIDENNKKHGKVAGCCWMTNLINYRLNEELILVKDYDPVSYPKYDNYEAIEVSKISDIPRNYDGVMGVPITFLGNYNPNQFKILGCSYKYGAIDEHHNGTPYNAMLNGKELFVRLFIRKK